MTGTFKKSKYVFLTLKLLAIPLVFLSPILGRADCSMGKSLLQHDKVKLLEVQKPKAACISKDKEIESIFYPGCILKFSKAIANEKKDVTFELYTSGLGCELKPAKEYAIETYGNCCEPSFLGCDQSPSEMGDRVLACSLRQLVSLQSFKALPSGETYTYNLKMKKFEASKSKSRKSK